MFKRKKAKIALPPSPRSEAEINEDYGRLVAQAGQCQYQIEIYKKDLERMNQQLQNLNYEAHARKELDKQEAPKAESTGA